MLVKRPKWGRERSGGFWPGDVPRRTLIRRFVARSRLAILTARILPEAAWPRLPRNAVVFAKKLMQNEITVD